MPWPTHIVAVAGLVEDGRGNVLLVKTYTRGWDVPGGQVENGETLEEALIREILEESGVTATVRKLAAVYSNVGEYTWHDGTTHVPTKVMFDFICDYVEGETRPSEETSEVKWVSRNEVMSHLQHEVLRRRISALMNHNGAMLYESYVTKPEFQLKTSRNI